MRIFGGRISDEEGKEKCSTARGISSPANKGAAESVIIDLRCVQRSWDSEWLVSM